MKFSILLCLICFVISPAFGQQRETNYDRIMRTHTLRCGYFIEAPFSMRDENTGHMSGIAADLVEAVAKELNLKVEWTQQVSFASFPQDLQNDRYDAVCSDVFTLPRAGAIDYSTPYAFAPVYGYVKPSNTAFDKPYTSIDWSKVTVAGLDGEGATIAAQKMLPQAKFNMLPQLADTSEMLLMTSTGKADIAFVLPSVFEDFNKTNSGALRQAKLDKPLYVYAVAFAIPRGQVEFKAMLNNVITQLAVSGELAKIDAKYDPGHIYPLPAYYPEK